jgi:hypothetical protein
VGRSAKTVKLAQATAAEFLSAAGAPESANVAQLGESRQTRKGEISELDERLTSKPSSSRVSSQWKSLVKSR